MATLTRDEVLKKAAVGESFDRADLRGLDLSNATLEGVDLRRADLPPCRYSERCPRKLASCDQPLPVLPPENPHIVACWNPL